MNLQENIIKVLREDRKLSNFLKRRLGNLDYEVESRLNNPFGGDNICIFFKSEGDFFETIMEESIESMYFNYFSNIDDNSGEWAHEYLDMVDYIRNKYQDKIMKHYDDNCGSGSIPIKESIRRLLRETVNESKGWSDSKQKLERTFKFKDFNESMEFVNKVAKIAESQNHHPDIKINYNKVKLSITDHEKGGVSDKCHKLVKDIDKL